MAFIFHACPTCNAKQDQPCLTPKGKKRATAHDTRPFSVTSELTKGVTHDTKELDH